MSPIASLHSADRELSIDLPVGDLLTLLLIFSHAWESSGWETTREADPFPQATILKRMDVLGFTAYDLVADYQAYGNTWIMELSDTDCRNSVEYLRALLASGTEALSNLAWSPEGAQLAEVLCTHWIDEYETYPSDSTVIRTALRAFRPTEKVYVSISQQALYDLIPNEIQWQEDQFPKPTSLSEYRMKLAWRNTKPIVLVEGSFDCYVLRSIFRFRYPELLDCLSIADFTLGSEGGTSGLRRTLRTLAQMEIPNTIIGLFDNDSAGREAVDLLRGNELPVNIGYSCYPDLEFARSYPTIGPTGAARADINGRALSIELFLGKDCLAPNGEQLPVEWTGYNRRTESYQGSIVGKGTIRSAFEKKLKLVRERAPSAGDHDWSSLDLLGKFIIQRISEIASRRSSMGSRDDDRHHMGC